MAELRSSFSLDPDSEKDAVEQYHDYLLAGLSLAAGEHQGPIHSDFVLDPGSPLDAAMQYSLYLCARLAAVSGEALPRSRTALPIGRRITSWIRSLKFWRAS